MVLGIVYNWPCGADTLLGLFGVRSTVVHEFGNGLCVLLTVASLRIQLVRLMDELAALQQTFSLYSC